MSTYNIGTHFALFLTRVALGGYLGLAGWNKVATELDKGIGYFYKEHFLGLAPDWLPTWFALPYGYALPWLELLVGGMLILGLFMRFFAAGGFLILTSILIAQGVANNSITAMANEAGRLTFNPTYIQAVVYFLLIFTGAGALSLDRLFFGTPTREGDER